MRKPPRSLRGDAGTSPLHAVVPYGPRGSSARVRAFDWLEHTGLKAEVHAYLGLPVNSPRLVLRDPIDALRAEAHLLSLTRAVRHSTVLLVREASPFSRGHVEATLLRNAQRGVYDFDDALMVPAPGLVERVFSKSAKWRRSVTAADVVIAGNDLLAEAATRAGPADVRLIPSCVEPADYRAKNDFDRHGPPTAVWLGSPATEPYLESIAAALLDVHRSHGLRLVVISAGTRSLGLPSSMMTRVDWSPDTNRQLADFDFGLMPLPDDPWTRGKCAYKLLQYGAAGLPMIGSPVGANHSALAAMGGFAAHGPDEWRDALVELSTMSQATLAERGRCAREGVSRHYSFSAWAPSWLDAIGATGD